MKRIPIKALKEFANQYGLDQVVVIARNNESDTDYIVTWGRTIKDCALAAISGNNQKRHMGWPEKLCHATPSRLKKRGITL
jgi:hypothetical protein